MACLHLRIKDDGAVFSGLFGCIQGLIGTSEQILRRVRFTGAGISVFVIKTTHKSVV